MVVDTSAAAGRERGDQQHHWTVTGSTTVTGRAPSRLDAICVGSGIAGYSEASMAQSVKAGGFAQLTEACPAGSVITGGGFAAGSTAPVINESIRPRARPSAARRGPCLSTTVASQTAQSVTTYVVCVSNTISGYSEKLAQSSTAGVVSGDLPERQPRDRRRRVRARAAQHIGRRARGPERSRRVCREQHLVERRCGEHRRGRHRLDSDLRGPRTDRELAQTVERACRGAETRSRSSAATSPARRPSTSARRPPRRSRSSAQCRSTPSCPPDRAPSTSPSRRPGAPARRSPGTSTSTSHPSRV